MTLLRGITWDHPRGYGPLVESARRYAALAGVQVRWEARSLKDFGDFPLTVLADEYDLLVIDHPHVGVAAATGCLLALDEWLTDDQLRALAEQSAGPSHASYHYAGHQWALALDAALQTTVYRADRVDGPLPNDWDGVLQTARSLRERDLWMALPLGPTDAKDSWLTLCASLGEAPGTQPGQLVTAQTGVAALELLRALAGAAHPHSLDWNPIGLLDYMSRADDVVYCPLSYAYVTYARSDGPGKRLTFAPVPGVRGAILGGAGYAVSARTASPDAASAYGAWLCGAESQRSWYVVSGGQPANRAAWQDAHANQQTHDFFRRVYPGLAQAYVRPRFEHFPAFQETAGTLIHRFLRTGSAATACFDDLTALYRDAFDRST